MTAQTIDDVLAEIARASAEAERSKPAPPEERTRTQFTDVSYTRPSPTSVSRTGASVGDYLDLSDAEFIDLAYQRLLGRPADPAGKASLLDAIRQGALSRARALSNMAAAPEAVSHGQTVSGVSSMLLRERLCRLPVFGRILRILISIVSLPGQLSAQAGRLGRLEAQMAQRLEMLDKQVETAFAGAQRGLVDLADALDEMRQAVNELGDGLGDTAEVSKRTGARVKDLERSLAQTVSEFSASRARLQSEIRLAQQLTAVPMSSHRPAASTPETGLPQAELDEIYVAFERAFRGEPSLIKSRGERYLPLMRVSPVHSHMPVLDVGCGRGEWLALLRENGLAACGVDLNPAMLDVARADGLDVVEADALAYLDERPERSLAAVTGFHIAEHLALDQLVRLLDAAYKALSPGGVVLFETPNPECLVVGAYSFHLDHSHVRPLVPAFMEFLMRQRGFSDVRIIRQPEDIDLVRPGSVFAPTEIEHWFQQPMDYAVFARKPL